MSMAFAALLVAGHSMAQEAQVLTLEQALEIAEARNPAFRQANNRVQLNGTEMRTTWLDQILPRANVTLFNTSFTGNHQGKATDNLGYPIDNPDAAWVYFSSTRQALDVSWRIQGASLFQAFRRQRITNRERNVARDRAFTEMDVSVRRLFMDALEQRELMLAEEELVAAREVDREVAERLFSLALRTRVDVLNAELAIEQQALARQQQRALFERAKLTLRTELGDDELGDFILADEPLPIFDPSALDADELVERALGVNPELRQREVAVESARLGVAENRNSWWPTVDLGMRVSRVAQTQETAALFDVSFDEDLDSGRACTGPKWIWTTPGRSSERHAFRSRKRCGGRFWSSTTSGRASASRSGPPRLPGKRSASRGRSTESARARSRICARASIRKRTRAGR
ncbi:MAG: hypothetical protein P8170_06555 [Gemmatimonadota bacterium]